MAPPAPESAPPPTDSMGITAIPKRPEPMLRVAQDWHVNTVPPKSSIKGKIIPAFLSHARRRLSVEVYRFVDPEYNKNKKKADGDHNLGYYEEAYIRILTPTSKALKKASKKMAKEAKRGDGGGSVMASINMDSDFDDGASMLDGATTIINGGGLMTELMPMPDYDGWVAKYKLPLKAITFKGIQKKCVIFLFNYRTIQQKRTIYFDTEEDAQDCVNFVEAQQAEEEKRLAQKFAANASGIQVNAMEVITLLVEIVGATDLPAGDLTSSDPYVVCYFNHKEVHRTNFIPKTLDPIWTLKTKALFLLDVSAKDLFQGDGLHLDIMEYDTVGKDERLGHSMLDPRTMYVSQGERLTLPVEGEKKAQGQLNVRVRHATPYDKKFLTEYYKSDNCKKGHAAINEMLKTANANKGGKSAIASAFSRNTKTEKHGMTPPVKKYRTRPGPDPERPEETEWMSMPKIEQEVMGDSREWIDAGSGALGRLFVEVLECKGLPNLDTGSLVGNVTDAFCCLVFEDTWAQTDIIDDDLDPKWMPWTKRAFIFHMYHSSSELYIGVFDHDGVDDHDLIGRIAVNISNLQPDTLYTLNYNIYPSGKWSTRDAQGQIKIRLRLEIDDDRKLLLSCLEPPKTVYVNVKRKKDFKVLHAVCNGSYDMDSYSLKTFFAYLDELQSYTGAFLYLKEAVVTLMLWRGHHQVTMRENIFLLPLHSAAAFLIGIMLVEYPQLFPSFFFLSISWVLIASMFFRRHHPNPWMHCKSFYDILVALVIGDSFPPATIESNQNKTEAIRYMDYWKDKADHDSMLQEDAAKEAEDEADEAERALDEIGNTNTDISTKTGGRFIAVSVDPLRPYMEPFQAYLAIACRLIRYVRNIFLWEECYLSFWLTFGCLVLSVACLFVPWFFLIRWTSRVVVWSLFGPWMRFVDIYYYTPLENMTESELAAAKVKRKKLREKYLAEAVERARIERESAKKLKTMKKYLFGKFIMRVPVLKEDRYQDFPLPESSAVPYSPKPLALAELAMKEAGYHRIRVPGQNLDGDMIPSMETRTFTDAPVGQATKKHAQSETDTAAYAKVGSIVAGAAVITYYGVPIASSALSAIFG